MNSLNIQPLDISRYFTCTIDREVGDSITHLKLQKLMYYAQSWSLVFLESPLFEEDFEAWAHGPVLPSIYEAYKQFGFHDIPACDCNPLFSSDVANLLEDIKNIYGEKSARYLEDLTHSELPWREARKGLDEVARCNTPISKETMKSFYTDLHQRNNEAKA
jgi:uncharacterized phage-associated protein